MSKKNKTTKKDETTAQTTVDVENKAAETAEKVAEAPTEEKEEGTQSSELADLQQQYDELKDKYMRMLAEFDNYKKRTVRERLELMGTAAKDTMSAIIPVLDDFDRAKKNAEADDNTEVFTEGVDLVYNKLYSSLKQKGLEPMDSTGETFDPELHEALTEIPAPTEDLKGKVIDTIERGYLLKDKIIRYAKVVVGK